MHPLLISQINPLIYNLERERRRAKRKKLTVAVAASESTGTAPLVAMRWSARIAAATSTSRHTSHSVNDKLSLNRAPSKDRK
jgi:hypothetical protein